jgi:hypothetical protein
MKNIDNFDLKDYISRDFNDPEHKGQSLIDIFLEDPVYYDYLLDNQLIDARAAYFISRYSERIRNTRYGNPYFIHPICFELADELLEKYSLDNITWDSVKTSTSQNISENQKLEKKTDLAATNIINTSQQKLLCPIHKRKLRFVQNTSYIDSNSNRHTIIPVLTCPVCSKLYTDVDFIGYKFQLRIGEKLITNLHPDKPIISTPNISNSNKSENQEPKSKPKECFIYKDNPPQRCINTSCNGYLKDQEERLFNARHNHSIVITQYCPNCGVTYLRASIQAVNKDRYKAIGEVPERAKPAEKDYIIPLPKIIKEITVKDFVIRKNSFQCHKKHHTVQQVDALINVINPDGNLIRCEIPASFCKDCGIYFILESTYQKLKNYGTIACRVTDEKTYLSDSTSGSSFRMNLATESILMQYGYNVRQTSSLTAEQRRNILKMLIDHNICSKDKVISHLDHMISLFGKQNTNKLDLAISKWQSDRDSISDYKVGSNRKVIVQKIRIKKPYGMK